MKQFPLLLFCTLLFILPFKAIGSETEELDKAIEQAQKQLETHQNKKTDGLQSTERASSPTVPIYSPKKSHLVSTQNFSTYIKKHKVKNLWVYGHFKVVGFNKKNKALIAKPDIKGFLPLIQTIVTPKTRFIFINPQEQRTLARLEPGDSFYISPRHPAYVLRIIPKNGENENIVKAVFSSQPKNRLFSSENSR
ncbi:hypothetical protein A946_09570 [Methylacidiphilum kamchatkense Kam1]|uniref:DUF4384 domain-containing protein n=1 Tax=Methylacidiphilum kamchatkense Kam1 TaxID=1202785 RepID=A0A0C1V359_9BACT|nr:hypothetical protein [Methylacidiphilum kamchatkense]KIE58130.1 hypothetical protein A946_09570 [Methylacidiphilum kamchatkense Kam1]QDQ41539.1 hypothetical protein kam1_285 [Methylacidiphilum kamchatkense Kam1]